MIQKGTFNVDGGFELSIKGSPNLSFNVQVSLDGKTFSNMVQNACDGDGRCTITDSQANQSDFRFYRLQVSDPATAAAGN
jgi:hypothetical protein